MSQKPPEKWFCRCDPYLEQKELGDDLVLAHEVRRVQAPPLPARRPEDEHPPESVEAAQIVLDETATDHLKGPNTKITSYYKKR